jgi:integrase
MPRARTGNAAFKNGCWQAHLQMPGPKPRKRKWFRLDPQPKDLAQAKDAARIAQEMLDTRGYVPAARDITVGEYAEKRWLPMQEKRHPASWTNNRSDLRNHILPDLGTLPMRGITKEHGKALRLKLNTAVREKTMRDRTARNIWHTATGMFDDATNSDDPKIAVLDANPLAGLQAPDEKSVEREEQMLYPGEFLQLVACRDVPIDHARLYTLAIYTQRREGEILGLEWRDIHLAHGTITVHHQADYVRGDGSDPDRHTKGRRGNEIKIDRELRPLLVAMQQETGGKGRTRLFPDPPPVTGEYGLAAALRKHLKAAGVERELLYDDTDTNRWAVFHDLRATGAVWRFKRGGPEDTLTDVMEDGAWSDLDVMKHYIRKARFMTGTPFPPLPVRLLGPGAAGTKTNGPGKAPQGYSTPKKTAKTVGATGIEPVTSSV